MPVHCLCLLCHASFTVKPSKIPRGGGKYCSKRCADQAKSQFSLVPERFWARVTKTDKGCWLWTGYTVNTGYGSLLVETRLMSAHRLSFELTYGPIPPGLHVCHTCDVRACVRPDHLFLGTHGDNMRDMVAKQRHRAVTKPDKIPRGERSTSAKMTDATVRDMRRVRAQTHMEYTDLARMFGVSTGLVGRIIRRETWTHVTDTP